VCQARLSDASIGEHQHATKLAGRGSLLLPLELR
jgi:hypothetical protein